MSHGTPHPELDLSAFRKEYQGKGLERENLDPNPLVQFQTWFEQARAAGLVEPNAMTCATADASGRVSVRTVLLKYFSEAGFVFFTNYRSTKAKQIAENPRVALLFPWLPLERQVSIVGKAEKITLAETLAYYSQRPHHSRIGAWVSEQSQVISSRKMLEMKFAELKQKWADGEVPVPDFWGGYRIVPEAIEFWQGAPSRLHDRFLYSRQEDGTWIIERLSP